MSWIITDTISIKASDLKLIKKEPITMDTSLYLGLRDFGTPVKTNVNKYKYFVVIRDQSSSQEELPNKTILITKEDYESIQKQLNDLNQRDLEFVQYVKDHLDFKPGTEAFEQAKTDFYGQFKNV